MKMSIAVTGALCAAAVSTAALAAKPTTRNRAEIPAEFRWDFATIYPSWEAWDAGMKELDGRIDAFLALKGTLAEGPAQLLKAYQPRTSSASCSTGSTGIPGCSATPTRDQAVGGRFQRIRRLRQARDRRGVVHARAAEDLEATATA